MDIWKMRDTHDLLVGYCDALQWALEHMAAGQQQQSDDGDDDTSSITLCTEGSGSARPAAAEPSVTAGKPLSSMPRRVRLKPASLIQSRGGALRITTGPAHHRDAQAAGLAWYTTRPAAGDRGAAALADMGLVAHSPSGERNRCAPRALAVAPPSGTTASCAASCAAALSYLMTTHDTSCRRARAASGELSRLTPKLGGCTAGQRVQAAGKAAFFSARDLLLPSPAMAEVVAKRLEFDPTETLSATRLQAEAALAELSKTVQELAGAARGKQAQIVELGKQSAEQGIGDNDLKRLKRQFDSNKATYVNIDQKTRFMAGLAGLEVDIPAWEAARDQHEAALKAEAEALRGLKASNEAARSRAAGLGAHVAQQYALVDAATAATTAQLDATAAVLAQPPRPRPAAEGAASLGPGPDEAETQQQVERVTALVRDAERSIAAAEAERAELEAANAAKAQQLAALRAEVERMELVASDRMRAADEGTHARDRAAWCEALLGFVSGLSGVSLVAASAEQLVLGIRLALPTSRGDDAAMREVSHELSLQLLPRDGGAPLLAGGRLTPAVANAKALLERAANGSEADLPGLVAEVRARLLAYWQRQVLVEAAAEVFPPSSSSRGPPHVRAVLPSQTEAEVLVPWGWPCGGQRLQLVELSCPALAPEAAAALQAAINADAGLAAGADLAGLLRHVAAAVEARLADADAA
ncbi:hypothetical protein HT031_006614 [Scenedesmus sp. PABB004]|nr:hypothetical protein HT031_006614 [Scenedesmus sp. PABB004]